MKNDLKPEKNHTVTVLRRKEILAQINEKGRVFVQELSALLDVSEVTIRNDLEHLEKKSLVLRTRGGAIKLETGAGFDPKICEKSKINHTEKARIGREAVRLINEQDTLIIDSGTTTVELVKNLTTFQELTIITNALNIANLVLPRNNINLIIPGGYMRKNTLSLIGSIAEKSFLNFHVDKLFLGINGFDTKKGIFTPNIEEARLNQVMIEVAKEVIILADSSKFGKKSLAFICPPKEIDIVVTDEGIPADDKKRLEDAGVKVIIACQ